MLFFKTQQFFGLVIVWLLSTAVYAESFVVIVHPSNNVKLDPSMVERIYLSKQKTFPNGEKAIPVNAPKDSEARKKFEGKFISKNDSQLESYWSMMMFSGKGDPPQDAKQESEIVELVTKNPNMLGYVSKSQVNDKVKVVLSF